jgi:hypothetical protein
MDFDRFADLFAFFFMANLFHLAASKRHQRNKRNKCNQCFHHSISGCAAGGGAGLPLNPKTTGGAADTGSIVGSTRLDGGIGADGGVVGGVGGVGFMASSRSLAVDKPGGTNWSLPLTAIKVASAPNMYLLMSESSKKNCLSAGAMPDIGCTVKTTLYIDSDAIIIRIKQKQIPIQNFSQAFRFSSIISPFLVA